MNLDVNIALCGDQNVATGMAVVIGSAAESLHPRSRLNAYIVDCGLGAERAKALQALGAKLPRTTVKVVPLPAAQLSDFPLPSGLTHLTLGAYARLFIHELLPDVDSIVYLDADLLVRADLARLQTLPLGEAVLAAVVTPDVPTFDHPSESFVEELPEIPGNTPYFNSGVMVLNLRKMRELSATTLYRAMAKRIRCRSGDQSILNAVFHDQWIPLDADWNRTAPLHPSYRLFEYRRQAIWHFLGQNKPWIFAPAANAGLLTLWQEQLDRLGWERPKATRLSLGRVTNKDRLRRVASSLRKLST